MKELEKILDVSKEELDKLNTDFILRYNFWHDVRYFHGLAGKEHYRLLTFISSLFKKEILFDIGTFRCMSAAALSSSMQNKIKSYDIAKALPSNPILPRVEYFLGDTTLDEDLLKSPFIFFDVNHDGKYEKIFYEHLQKIKWKGLMLCDDIKVNWDGAMESWWDSITEDKYDLTERGHWSGTGLIHFK
jgi:hypothetical protein